MRPYKSDPGDRLSKRRKEHLAFSERLTWLAQVVEGKELNVLPKQERVGYGVSGGELLATRAVFRQMLTRFSCIAHPGVASNAPGSLDIFPSRFRQSDWRGRPSHIVARASPPASRIEAGCIFSRNDIVDGSTHTGIPAGTNRRLHTHAPEGRSDNRPALQLQRRFRTILNRPRPGGAG